MPVECILSNDDGDSVKTPLTEAGQVTWFQDFEFGVLSRVIGVECPIHDLWAVIHIQDDPEVLATKTPEEICNEFSQATVADQIQPNGIYEMELSSKRDEVVTLTIEHSLPFTQNMN